MGSAASISFGLATVLIVFAVLAGRHPQLSAEFPRLLASFGEFLVLTGASAASFIGQVRDRRWRGWAHAATAACLVAIVLLYWPRRV